MPENALPFLLQCIGMLLSALISVLVWIGKGIYKRLGEISTSLQGLNDKFSKDISGLDVRLTRVETKCDILLPEEP